MKNAEIAYFSFDCYITSPYVHLYMYAFVNVETIVDALLVYFSFQHTDHNCFMYLCNYAPSKDLTWKNDNSIFHCNSVLMILLSKGKLKPNNAGLKV